MSVYVGLPVGRHGLGGAPPVPGRCSVHCLLDCRRMTWPSVSTSCSTSASAWSWRAGYFVARVGGLICSPISLWSGLGAMVVGGSVWPAASGPGPTGCLVCGWGAQRDRGCTWLAAWSHGSRPCARRPGHRPQRAFAGRLVAHAAHGERPAYYTPPSGGPDAHGPRLDDRARARHLPGPGPHRHCRATPRERAALWFHDRAQDTLAIHMTVEKGHVLLASQMGDTAPQPRAASEMPLWQELKRTRHLFSSPMWRTITVSAAGHLGSPGCKNLAHGTVAAGRRGHRLAEYPQHHARRYSLKSSLWRRRCPSMSLWRCNCPALPNNDARPPCWRSATAWPARFTTPWPRLHWHCRAIRSGRGCVRRGTG